jgi:hypothetical protein
MFTNRHYEALAAYIRHERFLAQRGPGTWERLVTSLCDFLAEDSLRFNEKKFLIACGVDEK